MGLLNTLKEIFGTKPVNIGELNKAATLKSPTPTLKPASTPTKAPILEVPKESLDDIVVTNEYKIVKQLIENKYPFIFISGKAGTGKSTLIRFLRNSLRDKNIVVVAPTGVAALNISGATIHSYFHFPPRIITDADIKKVKDRRLYINLNLLIIDEISMVRVDVIDAMDKFLRLNGPKFNLPFGGVQLLLIGDLFQLPPVVTRSEEKVLNSLEYASPYFFSAKSLEYYKLMPIELGKIFRQKDEQFTDVLNKIRVAEQLDKVLPLINSRVGQQEQIGNFVVTLTSTNSDADQLNNTELSKLTGDCKTFVGQATGKFALEDERLPSPINLMLKVGAQVMFTKNDKTKRWVNGTIGKVVSFKDNAIQVQLYKSDLEILVDVFIVKWDSYAYSFNEYSNRIEPYITGEYSQIPLMLAWAVTIHKSQGKTLEKIKVDIGKGAFATGQVYVALSRTRLLSDLSLKRPINKSDVMCDQRIKRFYLGLQSMQEKLSKVADNLENENLIISENQCPYCWDELRERNGKKGIFIGCSNYPRCTYTRNK